MKRAISILINLIISLSIFSVSLSTVNATSPTSRYEICGDYSYIVLADGTASIENYDGTATSIDIPSQLDGYKVTSLGRSSFYDFDNLESVTIHESVTNIDDSAFRKCDNLYEIKIDSDNPVFDSRENCNAIIESETNTLISGCNGTIIPSGVTSIAPSAFSGCANLESIIIPDNVTSIGENAFYGCTNLESIIIPDNVTSIGEDAFYVYGENICLYVAENSHAHKYAEYIDCNYKLIDSPDNNSTFETTATENSVVSDNAANSDDSGNKDAAKSNAYFFIIIAILLCVVILLLTAVIVLSILLYKKTRTRSCLHK